MTALLRGTQEPPDGGWYMTERNVTHQAGTERPLATASGFTSALGAFGSDVMR